MEETVLPPSPSWFLPNILNSREDGSVAYGSKNDVVILKPISAKSFDTLIINSAHDLRVTSVAFSPQTCSEPFQNTIASCAEDGLVKLWKIDTLKACIGHKSHWEQKEPCGKIICLDWSQANPAYIVSAADNNTLIQWDIISNTTVKFSFQKLTATTIACCPFNEKLVAVGVKSGLVFIINLTGNGEFIYKLRGHDNEIQLLSWCPVPYNIFRQDEVHEEFLIASSCQDKEVFIWRAGTDGKCELKIHIPTSAISKKDGDHFRNKLGNSFSFTALLWHDVYKLYLSSNFGELLVFDIESYLSKTPKILDVKANKHSLCFFKLAHHFHSKGLFAITSPPQKGDVVLFEDLEIKSELKFKVNKGISVVKKMNSDNGNVKWKIDSFGQPSLIWTAGQDRKLIACKFDDSKLQVVFNLHTLNGSVYSTSISPHDPNKIAIGTGDGIIRLWNLLQPSGEIQMYWQKVKDRVMSLSWHPTKDGILAYGTSEGRVGLIDTNTNKMPSVFKPSQPQAIYSLSWGPELPGNSGNTTKKEYNLYSVGGNTLSLYNVSNIGADPINLTRLLPFQCKKHTDVSWKPDYSLMAVGCDDGTIYLVEPKEFKIIYTLLAYKKMVQSIAWHPPSTAVDSGVSPYHTYFTSGSTDNDNEIRVFNYVEEEEGSVMVEQVASLKGHYGHIQSVCWSTHIGGRLASTSSDCSVQIWDVLSQTPLVNYKPITIPVLSIWSPIDADVMLTGCRDGVLCAWKISAQSTTCPAPASKCKKQKKNKGLQLSVAKDSSPESVAGNKNKDDMTKGVTMAEVKTLGKAAKEIKIFSKAWKDDSNNEFNSCYHLLKENNTKGSSTEFSLPFLCDDNSYTELIDSEEEVHKTSNNWTEYYELNFWNGKIKDVIEEKMKTGQLNDFLVSLAPTVSSRFWQEACLSYSKSLAEKKMYRKAASYLLCCHKIYEAINLLKDENLYLEALCLAKSRLPKSDPVLAEIIDQYGHWLFKNGSFLKACECFIYLNDYQQVAKICGKKSQAEYLSLAALAARKCGDEELESKEATNAVLKCLKSNNLKLARRICDDHFYIKHLRVMYHVYHMMHQLDSNEIKLEKDILTHVRDLVADTDVRFPQSLPHLYQQQTFYKDKQEMFVVVAQELSLAICSSDLNEMLVHVIKALSTCYRYIPDSEIEVDPLYKLCNWLSPTGLFSETSYFTLKEALVQAKVKSLREFVGVAIIRHLNENKNPVKEKILQWVNVLDELKDSFLSAESFKYFKNLIELEICEKRLMTSQNALMRCKLSANEVRETQNGDLLVKGHSEDEIQQSCLRNGVEFKNDTETLEAERDSDVKNVVVVKTHMNGDVGHCDVENLRTLKSIEGEEANNSDGGISLEEKIRQDKDLLMKLRRDIKDFEVIRISSPNPVSSFLILKMICKNVPESETAQKVLTSLEKKWSELNC